MQNTDNILNADNSMVSLDQIESELVSHIPELESLQNLLSDPINNKHHALSVIEEALLSLYYITGSLTHLRESVVFQE